MKLVRRRPNRPWHVRLGCRSAGRQLSVKGGEATCEALDGRLAVCYLRQVTAVCFDRSHQTNNVACMAHNQEVGLVFVELVFNPFEIVLQ